MYIDYTKTFEGRKIIYIARGPLCWGSGETLDRAIKNCRRHWVLDKKPKGIESYDILLTNAKEFEIADTGGIQINEEGCFLIKIQNGIVP